MDIRGLRGYAPPVLRRLLLAVGMGLVLANASASAQPEPRSLESLVRRATAVAEAQVIILTGRDGQRYPALEILDVLEGEPPDELPLIVTEAFEPPVEVPALWFLSRGSKGWAPVGPEPYLPLTERARVQAMLEVRKDPRKALDSGDSRLQKAALALLQPREADRLCLVGLLSHAEWGVRLGAAEALGRLDRAAAMTWLLKNWPTDDPRRFAETRMVVSGLVRRDVSVPVDTLADRGRTVELYRLAWELASSDRPRALARLPEFRRRVATEPGPWALEALALYPTDVALEGLAEALRNPGEAVVGRALELLRQGLQKPDDALRRVVAGAPGQLLRSRLQSLPKRTWSDATVARVVIAESKALLARLKALAP